MLVERKPLASPVRYAVVGAIATLSIIGEAFTNESDVTFPYQAIVLKESATVHSGPGQVHYATDELEQGATVEVHRHDPGGWCAVRPVRGSFSLVPAAAVDVMDDRVGEILESGTQAWVGTRLGAVEKPLWQVKLREGERVEILGEVSWPHPEGHSTIWYQISPPAGEFRWMRISDLQLPPATHSADLSTARDFPQNEPTVRSNVRSLVAVPEIHPTAQQQQQQQTQLVQPIQTIMTPTVTPSVNTLQTAGPVQLATAIQPDNMNLGWRRSTRPIPNTDYDSDDPVAAAADRAPPVTQIRVASSHPTAGFDQLSKFATSSDSGINLMTSANRVTSLSNVSKQSPISISSTRIQDLELRLTNELLKPPTLWQIEPLLDAAHRASNSVTSANERLLASRLIDKCQNCLKVRAGYANSGTDSQGTFGRRNRMDTSANQIGTGIKPADQEVSFGTTYDAYGWLNELVRKQGKLDPEYVLQNRDGKITHHVIASPGLNLRRYLKSKVGIIGQRGYNHALNLDHVVADRVVVLDQAR